MRAIDTPLTRMQRPHSLHAGFDLAFKNNSTSPFHYKSFYTRSTTNHFTSQSLQCDEAFCKEEKKGERKRSKAVTSRRGSSASRCWKRPIDLSCDCLRVSQRHEPDEKPRQKEGSRSTAAVDAACNHGQLHGPTRVQACAATAGT